ncbi:hypothetical protein AB0I82_33880 [Streptomyces sp. NPDC050315]|uniref:hypothetical protein n=1 Tax=Streptomyces sp. NPDC050315 TaxID=3155039 RepID=UPI003419B0AF
MSDTDTTPDGARTLHAVPDPEPLAGLTGAPAFIYTELVGLTAENGATTAELALAAGLGRSTAGKALVILEEHGLAVRSPGSHDGPRRTPDRWHPAPSHKAANNQSSHPEPVTPQPELVSVSLTKPDANCANSGEGPSDTTEPMAPAPDSGSTPAASQAPIAQPDAPTTAITLPGERKRLAPGALRQMVIDHLQAHPTKAFTATRISRVIEKSSGAIANALATLVKQGIAEPVSDKPRTYRLSATETGNE